MLMGQSHKQEGMIQCTILIVLTNNLEVESQKVQSTYLGMI